MKLHELCLPVSIDYPPHPRRDQYCKITIFVTLPFDINTSTVYASFFPAHDATHVRYALHTEVVRAGFGASTAFARGVFLQV